MGGFIGEDNYLGDDENVNSQNRYSYCEGDPVNYDDPTGHAKSLREIQMEYGLDSAVADFQDYADGQSSGTTKITDSNANVYIQAGADAAHGVNDAYNCVSGALTEAAIQAMADSINATMNSSNDQITKHRDDNMTEYEEEQMEYYATRPRFNTFYADDPGYENCYEYAIDYMGSQKSIEMYKAPLTNIPQSLQSRSDLKHLKVHIKEVKEKHPLKDGENMIAFYGTAHYMRYDRDIGWTHTVLYSNKILKLIGNPWDYKNFYRDEHWVFTSGIPTKINEMPDYTNNENYEWAFSDYYVPSIRYYVWWTTAKEDN